jgi:uncharacterized lipoprotein YddW (UPF0748 family)
MRTLWLVGLVLAVGGRCPAQVEQRAVWAHFADIKDQETVERTVERIAGAGMNAVYILVWYNGGQAAYRSELCPMQQGTPEGFDPLGSLIAAAKPRGIDVHAWFVNGSYGHQRPGHLFTVHPHWQLQSGTSSGEMWYDLGKPEVRAFQRDVMLECLRDYDVAGIHFDYIRFGRKGMCYCDHCQNQVRERFGIPPLSATEATFPLAAQMSGNPLGKAETAQVLAVFDDGVPAISLNRLGEGETLLINWQAERTGHPAVALFAKRMLERFGAQGKAVYQIRNPETTARYNLTSQQRGLEWLRGLGCRPKAVEAGQTDAIPAGATVVLQGQYLISPETATWLESHVAAGGRALFVDGPVFAIKDPSLQRVLGVSGTARYFNALRTIEPAPGQDLIPTGPPVDAALEAKRGEAWETFHREVVTDLVRQVYRSAKALKPQAQVSAAVFANRAAADNVCQDWYGWLDEGIIDYVLPMAYGEDTAKLKDMLDEWRAADPEMARILPGLSIYTRVDGKAVSRNLDLIREQQDLCRSYHVHGICHFSLAYLNEEMQRAFAEGPFATPAQPYYPAGK